jgi:hypothetical protein
VSRGPGRIERAIHQLLDANPDAAFVTDQLCNHCYGAGGWSERKHRVAVIRAAHNVLKGDPDWQCFRARRGMTYYNAASVPSTAMAFAPNLLVDDEEDDEDDDEDRAWRQAWRRDETARIEGMVAAHIAWRDATPEERAAIEREEEAERERGRGAIRALFAG